MESNSIQHQHPSASLREDPETQAERRHADRHAQQRHVVNGKSRLYQWAIKDAKLQGSEISFSVTHPFEVGHGEVTTSYRGKIGGDAIKGMLEMEFMGQTYTRDWKAERLKE